jgi:hypothetical protein
MMQQLLYAVGTVFLVCAMGFAEDVPKSAPAVVQVTSIPFDELVRTFATNEARAEAQYEGKPVTVKGMVVRVVTSRYPTRGEGKDAYLVELKAEERGTSIIYVQFFFDKAERAQLAELRAGQEVVIQGLCKHPAIYAGDRRQRQKDYVEVPFQGCKVLQAK